MRLLSALFLIVLLALPSAVAAGTTKSCMRVSGGQARKCLRKSLAKIEACRKTDDASCEDALRSAGGELEALLVDVEEPIRRACSAETASPLGYPSVDDVVLRIREACGDYTEDALSRAYGNDPEPPADPAALRCQKLVVSGLGGLRNKTLARFGPRCHLKQLAGKSCDRVARDAAIARKRAKVRDKILLKCGAAFDTLALSPLDPDDSTLEERIDELLDRTVRHARHLAQLVYPPNDLGPDADFGPHAVGVTTLALFDPDRLNATSDGPRPVLTDVYYPSTPEAVEGLDGDVVRVLGIEIVETPAFRNVPIADGSFPLVLFSHGNNGVRFQSFYFAAHLASHGYVVVSPDHHGNNFIDSLASVQDPDSPVNRPLDMQFLIDVFLELDMKPGDFFEGSIDENAIGASGHSFGGYTTWALAGPTFAAGTFTDPRVKAIVPQAPSSGAFPDEFFQAVTIPTLVLGGAIDGTTPYPSQQEAPWMQLPSGASIVGLAKLIDGGHFTFSDYCEVPRSLLAFLGGFSEACEPRHLPWRHAHDIANYLVLNFFDATLKADAGDLLKLTPEALAWIEDLEYQSK